MDWSEFVTWTIQGFIVLILLVIVLGIAKDVFRG